MELSDLLTWQSLVVLIVATLAVLVAWMKTPPYTTYPNVQSFLEALVSTLVLAFLVSLGLAAADSTWQLVSLAGLVSVIGTTYLGWGGVSILMGKIIPSTGSGPPAAPPAQ